MIVRRALLRSAIVVLAGAASGCLTREMLGRERNRYRESLSDIYVAPAANRIAVLGERYHYIFDAPPGFAALLASPAHALLSAEFSGFVVDDDENIVGDVVLDGGWPTEPRQKQDLAAAGLVAPSWTRRLTLRGRRYAAGGSAPGGRLALNRPYTVEIDAPASLAWKLAATPVTLLADGVLTLFGAPLLLFTCREKCL